MVRSVSTVYLPGSVSLRRLVSRELRFSVAFATAAKWDALEKHF